jgi:hypothetical protein
MRALFATGVILLSVTAFQPGYALDLTSNKTDVHPLLRHAQQFVSAARSVNHVATEGNTIVPHPAGCPRYLFCGCGASEHVFGHPVRSLYLVRNWYQFPRAAPAQGMAVLFGSRHVAIIEQYHGDGTATLYDANSGGGLTRMRRAKIAGLVVVDPHGERSAAAPGRYHIAQQKQGPGYMGF